MRQERALRIKAFRRALELGAGERADGCRHFPRWKEELKNFPHGSCDLASNTLAQYLTYTEGCHPCIIFMEGSAGFHEAENSTVHAHVIVLLDVEYINLTLDQYETEKLSQLVACFGYTLIRKIHFYRYPKLTTDTMQAIVGYPVHGNSLEIFVILLFYNIIHYLLVVY